MFRLKKIILCQGNSGGGGGRTVFSPMALEQMDMHMQKNEVKSLLYTTHKN